MGKVYLVGAGPGAADLVTVRGARLLGRADVVLHDALIEPQMLLHAPNALKISVGKRCGQHSVSQEAICEMIVNAARMHEVVVRLKGGDPMLFGRASEEMRALEAAGVEYEIVPGITAALAGAAALRRSLTLRGVARSVVLATCSSAPHTKAIDDQPNADSLVLYMGRDTARDIALQLISAGRPAATPVGLVEACTTARERILTLTLAQLASGHAQTWFDPTQPSLIMVGAAFRAGAQQ